MNIKMEYPSLETERIKLRLLTLDDAEDIFVHFSDRNITKFMDIEPCKNIKEAEELIQFHIDDVGCRWGMYEKQSDTFIGTVGFHYLRRNEEGFIAEIGFDLAKDYWGKGYMAEAVREVILFGFSQMGLDMIDATVEPENERSLKLMRKLRFSQDQEPREGLVYFYLKDI